MILCSGCFDGLHAGHVRYLAAASALRVGDERLIVAVAPDVYVATVKRRVARWPVAERARVLIALRSVDEVVTHSETGAADQILALKPRLFVKGEEWAGHVPGDVLDACRDVDARLLFVHTPGRHTADALSADA